MSSKSGDFWIWASVGKKLFGYLWKGEIWEMAHIQGHSNKSQSPHEVLVLVETLGFSGTGRRPDLSVNSRPRSWHSMRWQGVNSHYFWPESQTTGGWRVASGLVGGAAVQALRCPAGSRGLWTQRELLLEVQRETAGTSKGDFHLAGALQSASCWRITNLIILLKGMSFFYKRNCTYVLNALLSARDRRQGPKGMLFFKEDKELQYFTSMDINLGAVGERKDVLGLREQDQNKT